MNDLFLAYDIGGTHIKFGVVDEKGRILTHDIVETEAAKGGPHILEKLISIGRRLEVDYTLTGIAVSTAGRVDPKTGVVVGANDTIPNFVGINIQDHLHEFFNLPISTRNDAECAILCEQWLGNHEVDDMMMLTIGTGIGGGIIINRETYSGHSFSAGEWGRMQIEGRRFEEIASLQGLIQMARKVNPDISWTGEAVFAAADKGDAAMRAVVRIFYRHLAIGIANLIYVLNPEKIILGGGLTHRSDLMISELKQHLQEQTDADFLNTTEIAISQFSNHAGMLGAVYDWLRTYK